MLSKENNRARQEPPKTGGVPLFLILLTGIVLTCLACLFISRSEKDQGKARFDRLVESRMNLFLSAGENYEEVLFSLRNLFLSRPDLSEAEFVRLTDPICKRHKPIQALEWVPRVSDKDRATVEQAMREAGHAGFEFFDLDKDHRRTAAPSTADHFPILYLSPMKGNEPALGYDLAFGPTRPVLEHACDINDTVISGRFRLIQEPGTQYGLVSVAPVYRGNIVPKSVEERRKALVGYVQIVFRLGDMIERILDKVSPGGVDILIKDLSAKPDEQFFYYHPSRLRSAETAVAPTAEEMRHGLSRFRKITMGERELGFYFRPSPEWLAAQQTPRVPAAAAAGFIITVLVAGLFQTVKKRTTFVEKQVELRTNELQEANRQLERENTERRHAEAALRESELRFRSLVEHAPVGVWQLEPDGKRIRYLNPVLRTMLGLKPDEKIEGRNIRDFISPGSQSQATQHLNERLAGVSSSYEIEYILPDKSLLPSLIYGAPLKDETGKLIGVIGLSIDIAERRRAKNALIEERKLLRTLIDTLPDPIFVKDRAGHFLATNDANRMLLGLDTTENAIGKTVLDLFPKDTALSYQSDDEMVMSSGEPIINREEPYELNNGQKGWFLTSKVPLRNAKGDVIGLVGISRDITQQKKAEGERSRFEQKLQESQKLESLGVLAGGIAHDFNNLLTGILGHASLGKLDAPPNSPMAEYLDQIEKSSQRAAELCRQMLAYAGKGRFVVQNLDLSDLVDDITHLLQLSISKKAVLRLQLTPGLPPVSADATQIRQIIMNLVINASDAVGDKSGVISLVTGIMRADREYLHDTYLSPELPEGDYVFLEVSDTGIGMDKDTLSRIFDPFFTTKFTGRGLGLAAVLGIIRAHKGALKVYSEAGRGSTFKLLLPVSTGLAAKVEYPQRISDVWKAEGTVLVVDDEETVRAVSARILESFGFKTIMAQDGRDALKKFTEHQKDITMVLMDLTMPHMDGEQAFRELRKIQPDVKVLLMSGFNEQEAINRFTGKGLSGFIQKPFKLEEIQEKLKFILENDATGK